MSTTTVPQVSLNEDQVQDMVRRTASAYAQWRRGNSVAKIDWLAIYSQSAVFIGIMARTDLFKVGDLMEEAWTALAEQGDLFGAELACERALYGLLAEIHS
jgi:hypothetical protein